MHEIAAPTLPTEEDYRRYDRVWRRVSPEYDPYPEVRAAYSAEMPASPDRAPAAGGAGGSACCMGDAEREELEGIRGFLRDELADAQTYRALALCAPDMAARRTMRALAAEKSGRVRTLQTAYFLIAGETYHVTVVLPPQRKLPWRDRLRERWHAEACAGFNYERAAEKTADVCLKKTFADLSRGGYRSAETLRALLERCL